MEDQQGKPTIAEIAQTCLISFQRCLGQMASVDPREQSLVEDQLGRFSIWGANIGAFAPGRASMDHRLREVPDIQSVVIGLLDVLNDRIQYCSSALESFDPSQPRTSDNNVLLARENFERAVSAIAKEINLLYKLSNTIRRASKESQNLKAASSFKIKDEEGNDLESVFRERFANNILDQFPHITEVIRNRLASAMLLRRKRILYRRSRYAETPIRPTETVLQPTVQPRPTQSQSTMQPTQHEQFQRCDEPVSNAKPAQSAVQSQAMSATTLAADNFKKASSPSMVSVTKTVALSSHEDLIFPPSPQGHIRERFKRLKAQRQSDHAAHLSALPFYSLYVQHRGAPDLQPDIITQLHQQISHAEQNLRLALEKDRKDCNEANLEVICPFCFYTLSSLDIKDDKKWREHVKNDLDAYVCLFEECDKPQELYNHSEKWLKHMRQHTLRWRCNAKSHGVQLFDSQDDYENHMRERHKTAFTEAQLPLLAETNARATEPMFKYCPLCGVEEVKGPLEDHIIGHLRCLALRSLPRIDDGDDEDYEGEEPRSGTIKPPSRSTIKAGLDRNVRLTFNDDNTYLRALERGNGDTDSASPYAKWGGYAKYVAKYPKGLRLSKSPHREHDQLFELPAILDGVDYPFSWPADQSVRFVEAHLFTGVSEADLRQFEWGFVLNKVLQPHRGHESDPTLQSFLQDKWKETDHDEKASRSQAQPAVGQDGKALAYVKNVYQSVDVEALKAHFSKYGELAYFDVSYPENSAVVEFANAAAFRAAVAANPHKIGNDNVYVEEWRLTSQLNQQGEAGSRGCFNEDSEEPEVQVMETNVKVLDAGHPETLTSVSNLAEDHPDRLTSQHELARAYRANGQVEEALQLLEHVVEVREGSLSEDHPDLLASQHELARAYEATGKLDLRVEWQAGESLMPKRMGMQTPDIVIAVMGITGAGKSSFIRRITGNQSTKVRQTLRSETEEVVSYQLRYCGKNFTLIDTPGFDDSRFNDDIVVEKVLQWLRNSLMQGITLNGVIYIHPIIKPRIGGTASSHIRMFRQLCGKDFYRNVVLATTFWEDIDPSEGSQREKELFENDEFWGILVKGGSRVVRLGLDHKTDQKLLLTIAEQNKCILQAQQEIQEDKDISDTAAAKEVKENIINWFNWFEDQLRLEDQKCRHELADHIKRAQDQSEVYHQTPELKQRERELSQKRTNYNKMKELWLQRQKEQEIRRHQRSAALQTEILQLQQNIDLYKRSTDRIQHHVNQQIKCRRVSIATMMCCSKCQKRIRPKNHRFYHCCLCHNDDYDHCEQCGSQCENWNHPEMKLIDYTTKDGCLIM